MGSWGERRSSGDRMPAFSLGSAMDFPVVSGKSFPLPGPQFCHMRHRPNQACPAISQECEVQVERHSGKGQGYLCPLSSRAPCDRWGVSREDFLGVSPAQATSGPCCVWSVPPLEQTPWPLGPLSPARALQEINQTWLWGSDWSWLSRANTKVTYKSQVSSLASVCSCFRQGAPLPPD